MSRVLEWKSGQLLVGDMGVRLGELEECSVDACITDPPYHLGFMSLGWDGGDVGFRTETWAAVYRVLKPGAYLLSVGGPRTYHRMASAVEGAGFEIRDCIGWCHSQGVPKSVDVAGGIERSTGAGPAEWAVWLQLRRKELGMSREDLAEAVACAPALVRDWEEGREGRGGASEYVLPPPLYRKRLAKILGYPESSRSEGAAAGGHQAWDGWGTGLKPGWEMILVARKPLVGTVAENVLAHGTGVINVGGCRVGAEAVRSKTFADGAKPFGRVAGRPYSRHVSYGRWPSNLVFSHHVDCVRLADSRLVGSSTSRTVERWACVPDCPVRRLDDQAETRASDRIEGLSLAGRGCNDIFGLSADLPVLADRGEAAVEDSAAASRFFPVFPVEGEAMFYAGKAAAAERPVGPDGTKHATVKPLALVRWLVRLVTPPGGTVLDPFMGSGSLAEAAALESVRWVGIEICDGTDGKPDYVALIEERMKRFDRGESPGAPAWMRQEAAGQASLFGAAS